jgi:hypothetical protein
VPKMSIAFRSTGDLAQHALLEREEPPSQALSDPAADAPSADDDAAQSVIAQATAAAQALVPWQQRMPPLSIDSPAFTIKTSAPTVQRDARDGGGGNDAGGGNASGGRGGGGGASSRTAPTSDGGTNGREAPSTATAGAPMPSAGPRRVSYAYRRQARAQSPPQQAQQSAQP